MRAMLAPTASLTHIDPETLARYVDGRDTPNEALHHLRACSLCRARASDARLLRALIAGKPSAPAAAAIPLDASTLAGYHDQALAPDQMAAIDRRLLRDDEALLELLELRLGLNAAQRAEALDAKLLAIAATAFATAQSPQTLRVASLGTMVIDRNAELPTFHFYSATPEGIAGSTRAAANDSGSYPAPAARREQTLHAGRHTIRVRIAPGERIVFFVFDEQYFRPAQGVRMTCAPETGSPTCRATNQAGVVLFELPAGHARLQIDAGDRWLLELR